MAKLGTAKAVYSSQPTKTIKTQTAEKVVFTPVAENTFEEKIKSDVMKSVPFPSGTLTPSKMNTTIKQNLGNEVSKMPVHPVVNDDYKQFRYNNLNLGTLGADLQKAGDAVKTLYDGWQDKKTMDSLKPVIENAYNRLKMLDSYNADYGDGSVDISEQLQAYKSILDEWDEIAETYGKYDSADKYNKAQAESNAYIEKIKKMESVNLETLGAEVEAWKKERNKIIDNKEWLNKGDWRNDENGTPTIPYSATSIPAFVGKNIMEMQEMVAKKKELYNLAKRHQNLQKLSAVLDKTSENYDKNAEKYIKKGKELDFQKVGNDYSTDYVNEEGINTGTTYIIDDLRAAAIAMAEHNGTPKTETNGDNYRDVKKYRHLKEDEFDLFAYYLGKDEETGGNQAKEYLEAMEETLQTRMGTETYEKYLKDNAFLETLYAVPVGLNQFATGAANLFNTTDDYIPVSSTQVAGQLAREDLKDVGFKLPKWLGGGSSGQGVYDVLSTTANMAPSILASAVANYVVPGSGAYVGGALMGASAAGNAYQEALNGGMDKSQARTYSALVGISEAALSALLSKAMGGKALEGKVKDVIDGIDNKFLKFAANYGVAFTSEGLEEGLQEVLTPFFENFALGYGKNGFDDIDWGEVAYSYLLGGLSGGMFEAGPTAVKGAVNYLKNVDYVKKTYGAGATIDNLINLGLSLPTETKAYKYAKQINDNVNSGKKVSSNKLYNLVLATENIVADRLNQLGETNNLLQTSDAVVKKLSGLELTVPEIEVLSKSSYGQEVLENMTPKAEIAETTLQDNESGVVGENASAVESGVPSATAESGNVGVISKTPATFNGVDTNNTKHLDGVQQKEIKSYGEKLGRKVVFEDFYSIDKFNGKKKIPDGYIDKDGTIHINYYAKRPVQFLLKHEITHYLKRSLASYVDFMNLVFESEAFSDWLNKKGYTLDTLKAEIMETYSEVKGFDEERCYDEILANFVGEYLFGGENAVSQKLINALEPKQKKTFMDVIKDIIDYLKSKFQKIKSLQDEINKIEKEFIKVYKEAIEVEADETSADIGDKYEYINPLSVTETDISQNLIEISKMNAVSILTGQEFAKGKKDLVTQVDDFFDKYNHSIENSLLGDVEITARGAKDSIAHGIGRNKAIAFAAVPDVIQQGKIIDYQKNWKNRGYDTVVLAAPITINNDPYYEGVIVIRDSKTQRFYVHEVITEKRTDTSFKTGANKNVGKSGDASSPSIISLLDKIREVKENLTFEEVDNNNSIPENEDYSIPNTATDKKSILTDLVNGVITVEEAENLLSGKKTLNPIEIANLSEEKADTTASERKRKQGENIGDGKSKFYDSLMKSDIFDEQFKDEIKDDAFIEKYKTVANKETLQKAAKELDEGGSDYVEKWWSLTPERANLIDTAVGFILMDRYQRMGKYEQAVAAAEKVREFGTASGQQVQIFSIIGRFNPEMMVAYAKKELSQAFEAMVEGKTKKWIDNNKDKFQLTEKDIEFIRRHTLQAAMFEEGTRPKAIALAEIQNLLQDKIPPELGDSIRAFQRNAMLLNVKTNVRNVTGNAGMVGVFIASDLFGSGIDKALAKKTGVRTTGNFDVKSVAGFKKGLYESYDDFKRGISTKQEELNRFDTNTRRGNKSFNESGEGVFGTKILKKQLNDVAKALNKIDNFTSFCLEAGDRPFFEMWYMNSLNTQLKLNNLEIPTAEMLEIAKEEALKRTWQDDNIYTRAISNLKRNLNIVRIPGTSYGLGDFIYKFVKTPTNLAKAIVEFSPLGFAGATNNAIKLKNAIETNQFNPQLQKEFVRSASNAITGTLVYALVAIGAALGVVKLSGDGDDDKDVSNYEKYVMGVPPYSIEFFGVNMTYDWMQPFGSVLATVADFMQTKKEEPELKTSAAIWEAIKAGGKTFTKQSFLQSMYEFFSQDDIVDGLSSLVLAEPSAFIPQAFSQLASYLDKYRRTTYDSTNAFQTSINKVIAKIPGLRTKLPKQVNVLGEDAKNTQYLNVWEAFASPWNTYPKSSKEVVNEIYDLYKKTGENSVIPRTAPNNFTVKGDKVSLTPEQKTDFQRSIGQNSAEMLGILFNEPQYQNLSDSEKVDVVGKIYGFAYAKAKSEIKYDYKTLSAMAGEYKNGKPVLSEESYKKLPEKARQMIAQEYFLSKTEYRYIDNYKSLVQSYIQKVKE